MAARPGHCIRVHAGPPARGACKKRSYEYTRGDIDIVPAGLEGTWHSDQTTTALIIEVPPALLLRAAEELGVPASDASVAPRHQIRDERIEHVAWALAAEQRAGSQHGRLYTESLGLALAFHMLAAHRQPALVRRGLSARQLATLDAYIDEHLDRDLSIPRLAAQLAISPSHLTSLFRVTTGRSVHDHVMRRRVARAKQLLRDSARPASEIALETGFAHQSHMARWLRRVLGVTPSSLTRTRSETV